MKVYRIFSIKRPRHLFQTWPDGSGVYSNRVLKGILGVRDLTKIRCEIRENAKYLDGNQDLTALWEAGFAKIWARDAGFFVCLSGIREIVKTQINVLAA